MSTDTEQEENAPVIVDCDVLEAAKENIQPIARGRRVTALSAILSTPHAQRDGRLAAARNRFRMNVELALENSGPGEDSDDDGSTDMEEADPLEAYCQYVNWVVENYPQGHSAESGLLELLEEATRVLKDHQGGRWRGDLRYLKLWVLYASYVEKPAIIFKFCMVNEIGTSHALLYEEFAIALERAGRKTQADETYRIGIARKASPMERLESKYADFQKRMMASPRLPSAEEHPEATTPASSAPTTTTRRKALGEAASSRSSTRTTRAGSRADSATPASTPTLPQHNTRSQANARIQVFVDPTPEDTLASEAINEEGETSPWADLGTRKSRIKENVKEATKAAGTTLRQSSKTHRAVPSHGASKISVYRDPAPAEVERTSQGEDSPEEIPTPSAPSTAANAKSGKTMVVFRDEEPVVAPASKKAKFSTKSSIPVFRDASSSSTTTATSDRLPAGKSTSKSAISIFRDEPKSSSAEVSRPSKGKAATKVSAKTPAKGAIAVFRDEEPQAEIDAAVEPKARGSKSKGSIAVFRDEQPSNAGSSSKSSKGRLAILRDEDTELPNEPATEPKTRGTKSKSSIAVFRDDPSSETEPLPKPSKGKLAIFRDTDDTPSSTSSEPKKSNAKMSVFRDELGAPDIVAPATKAKGKISVFREEDPSGSFTPYRDEDTPKSPTIGATALGRTKSGTGVGLGIAGLGPAAAKMSFEAEALRKDPLKNYADDLKVLEFD